MKRRGEGLCGPRAPAPGAKAPGPLSAKTQVGKAEYFRQFRWGYGKFVGFWPKKVWENTLGKASFSQGIFPDFPRMLCIRDGDSFRRLNRRKSAQRTLLVSPDLTSDRASATGGCPRFVHPGCASFRST